MILNNKIYSAFASILIILSLIILGLYDLYVIEKSECERLSNNVAAIITDKARQQELSVRELKLLYPRYDSLANILAIKTKNISNILEVHYSFKDTTLTKTILSRDSITEKRLFTLNDKCYRFSGFVNRDTIGFTRKELTDRLTTFIYKDWEHKYFFKLIKTKPFYNAKTFSECLNDTVAIENNIVIMRSKN